MIFSDYLCNILKDFIDDKTIQAISDFIEISDENENSVNIIAKAFNYDGIFSTITPEYQTKLIKSFTKNLKLLIEKTWVEKTDITVKQQILFQLENLFNQEINWKDSYETFREILDATVFLMFGQQAKAPDFCEYSLRIDPDFGIFWCFVQNLPHKTEWSAEKCKSAILLGMYFLANY